MTQLLEQEYMSLATGVGVIPEKFRNRGYAKLDFAPGEGGIGLALAQPKESGLTKADMVDAIRALVSGDLGGKIKTTSRSGGKED